MPKKSIFPAPPGKLPYSPGVRAGDFIYVSGQVGHLDDSGSPISGIAGQTRRCLEKMKKVLQNSGASLDNVVKVNVYLSRADGFAAMNEAYASFFNGHYPARTTVITGLPVVGALVEIDAVAYKAQS